MFNIFQKWQCHQEQNFKERLKETADDMFQIREYDNELWFTHNGFLYAPCKLVCGENKDYVAVLAELRRLYIQRKTQKNIE